MNQKAEIIGVQSSHIGSDTATTNMGFMAPLPAVRQLMQAGGDVQVPTLDVCFGSQLSQSTGFLKRFPKDVFGVVVHDVYKRGAAAKAGLKNESLITHCNGEPVAFIWDLQDRVRAAKVGDVVTLTVMAPDTHQISTLDVKLEAIEW